MLISEVIYDKSMKGVFLMPKYGRKAAEKVKRAMRERKRGTLKSGRSGKKLRAESKPLQLGYRRLAALAEKFRVRRPKEIAPRKR